MTIIVRSEPQPVRRDALPHPRIAVRNATTADAPQVLEVWNDGLPSTGVGEGSHDFRLGEDQVLDWIVSHQKAMRPLWLASADDQPAALLSFIGFHDRPWCHAAAELAIHVRHALRGRGLGRVLLQRAIAAAPALRYDRYVACIRSDNAASAALFTSCGFERWGCVLGVMQTPGKRFDMDLYGLEMKGFDER